MKDTVYLIFNKRGVVGTRKRRPALKAGEATVRMTVEIPKSVFERLVPEVQVNLDATKVMHNPVHIEQREVSEPKPYDDEFDPDNPLAPLLDPENI